VLVLSGVGVDSAAAPGASGHLRSQADKHRCGLPIAELHRIRRPQDGVPGMKPRVAMTNAETGNPNQDPRSKDEWLGHLV
jgi:hypothetical protein